MEAGSRSGRVWMEGGQEDSRASSEGSQLIPTKKCEWEMEKMFLSGYIFK